MPTEESEHDFRGAKCIRLAHGSSVPVSQNSIMVEHETFAHYIFTFIFLKIGLCIDRTFDPATHIVFAYNFITMRAAALTFYGGLAMVSPPVTISNYDS